MSKKRKKRKKHPLKQRKDLKYLSYIITDEPIEDKHSKRIPKKIRDHLDQIYGEMNSRPRKVIPQLTHYIEKYPNVPILYNYLCVAYGRIGDFKNLESAALENYKRNPDYLFAKLNYAEIYLRNGEPEKVAEILDNKFDLKLLYPKRSTFHVSEFVGFMSIMCKYYDAIGERETAELLFNKLKEIAPDHPSTNQVKKGLYPSIIGRTVRKLRRKR